MKQFYRVTGVVTVEASDDDIALEIVENAMNIASLQFDWLYTREDTLNQGENK